MYHHNLFNQSLLNFLYFKIFLQKRFNVPTEQHSGLCGHIGFTVPLLSVISTAECLATEPQANGWYSKFWAESQQHAVISDAIVFKENKTLSDCSGNSNFWTLVKNRLEHRKQQTLVLQNSLLGKQVSFPKALDTR